MIVNSKIYNIPCNYKFIPSVTKWIKENHVNFNYPKIFLPNQRLCRELKKQLNCDNFLNKNFIDIKAINDLNLNDFYIFLPNIFIEKIIEEISTIKVIDSINAIFLIIDFISTEKFFINQNFTQKFKIAKNLYNLFNDIEINEIDLKKFIEFDDSNLSKHHQFTLEFFINFITKIKNYLLKNNSMFIEQYHNFIVKKYCDCLRISKIKQNIIIAGSTGSVNSSKKLIKTVYEYEFGSIFISGYKSMNNYEEIHPQYFLNELIKYIHNDKKINLIDLKNDEFKTSTEIRDKFNELIFEDYSNYQKTKEKINFINTTELKKDLNENLNIIEAQNEIIEAKFILDICKNANYNNKIAIISNNENLINKIKLNFELNNILFNNSLSQKIINNEIIDFLIIIYKLKNDIDFNAFNFLSLIKHPLFIKFYDKKLIYNFEIDILRNDRINQKTSGIIHKINNSILKSQLSIFFEKIIESLPKDNSLKSIIKSCELYANNSIEKILCKYKFGEEFYNLINIIINKKFIINHEEDIKTIFSEVSYFENSSNSSQIDILSPLEARLLDFDLIILASCNEDEFPQRNENNWISNKIKKELGVNNNLKKIGQNGFDLYHYLSSPKIIITHTNNKLGAKFVESSFITKIKTLSKFFDINIEKTNEFKAILDTNLKIERIYIKSPIPKVSKENLPNKINITDISKIITNPYAVYIEKILHLNELKKINYEASYKEYGNFVHNVLEEFVRNESKYKNIITNDFLHKINSIFACFFQSDNAKLIWLPKFLKVLPNFLNENSEFIGLNNFVELKIDFQINNMLILGKVDRIVANNQNECFVIDYKTGKSPSKNQVFCGKEPQLLIYSLVLKEGILKNHNITKLLYWNINNNDNSGIKVIESKSINISDLINITQKNLENIIDNFYIKNNIFYATNSEDDDLIKNISRIQEWKH